MKRLLRLLLWLMSPLARLWPRRRSRRSVLFVCNSALMAEYLAEIWELLKDDKRLRFRLALFNPGQDPHAGEYLRRTLPVGLVNTVWAYVRRWDLIVAADHAPRVLADRRRCPTLRVQHGIASGVRQTDTNWTFGRSALDFPGRRIRYTRLFVASEANRDHAIATNPGFRDVAAVVGNLHDDKMLALADRRDEIRRELGFTAEDTVVFVLSSWGPNCLFNTVGDAILAEARNLLDEFRFILNVHPNEYRPKPPGQRVWGEYLRTCREDGFTVREPDESWAPYMVACDVLLTDFTSLALRGALLEKPTVYVPVPDGILEKGSLVWRLRDISPQIQSDASDLRACLLKAIRQFSLPLDKLREIARDVNSHPGRSRERCLDELYALLRLPPPHQP